MSKRSADPPPACGSRRLVALALAAEGCGASVCNRRVAPLPMRRAADPRRRGERPNHVRAPVSGRGPRGDPWTRTLFSVRRPAGQGRRAATVLVRLRFGQRFLAAGERGGVPLRTRAAYLAPESVRARRPIAGPPLRSRISTRPDAARWRRAGVERDGGRSRRGARRTSSPVAADRAAGVGGRRSLSNHVAHVRISCANRIAPPRPGCRRVVSTSVEAMPTRSAADVRAFAGVAGERRKGRRASRPCSPRHRRRSFLLVKPYTRVPTQVLRRASGRARLGIARQPGENSGAAELVASRTDGGCRRRARRLR
jgi:hypothetical protein